MEQLENKHNHKFLIIARVGDGSLHKEWLHPVEFKSFDLCISYFGDEPGLFEDDCDYYFETKGPKWPMIKEAVKALGDKIHDYEAIWIPDDDILTDASNIHEMFELFVEQKFELAQPALTEDSYYSHFITQVHPDYLWRYSPFVEIMVPIFSKRALQKCWHTFDLCQTGWGLDLLWPKILGDPYKKIAMIDKTPVTHTRPIGGGTLYNGLSGPKELRDIEERFGVNELTYASIHYDGVLQNKRIFVLILAHENEEILRTQIQNIQHFNPNAGIILYNGGNNKHFANDLKIPVCPYSRPIKWAVQARVLWDVMKWLEETEVEYDYLVSFDHDMLFVKDGFEQFLDDSMKELDCMGWQLLKGTEIKKYPDPRVPESFWREWDTWQPIFKTDDFLRYFNPGQVFRRRIIHKMVSYLQSALDQTKLDDLFTSTKVYGFEEMFSVTLAKASGGNCGQYPNGHQYNEAIRWGEDITIKEVKQVLKNPSYFFIHPIKYERLLEMNDWLQSHYDVEVAGERILVEVEVEVEVDVAEERILEEVPEEEIVEEPPSFPNIIEIIKQEEGNIHITKKNVKKKVKKKKNKRISKNKSNYRLRTKPKGKKII